MCMSPYFPGETNADNHKTPDSSCWPPDNDWSAFNETVHGALIRGTPPGSVCYPDQPNYDEKACEFVTSQWHNSTWHAENPVSIDYPYWTNNSCTPIYPNGTGITGDPNAGANGCSIGAYPEFVVNASSAEQIATSLRWSAEKNVRVVVKATGHSFSGRSIGYGSLSIWTHGLRGIEYIPEYAPTSCPIDGTLTAVRAAAGHNGIEVQAALASHGMIAVTGANPDVGLVGWLTGGGHGTLSQTYGMGADNLLEATIVTPSGDVLVTNPCVNSDLFFAIRGGGGSTYGVVTEVVMRTYPTPSVVAHTLQLMSLSPNISADFWDFAGFFHAEMPRLKNGGLQGYYSLVGPPVTPTPSFSGIFILYDTTINATKELMAPVTQYLDERSDLFAYQANFTEAPTYMDAYQYWPNEQVAGGGSAMGSRLLTAESLSDASKTAELLQSISQYSNPSNKTVGHLLFHHPTTCLLTSTRSSKVLPSWATWLQVPTHPPTTQRSSL
jgi:hypothetical protein